MANTFFIEILTPEKCFFSGEIEAVTINAIDGKLTVLANHAPLLCDITSGELSIKKDGEWKEAFHSDGFLEVKKGGSATIFSQACEWPYEIDSNRAIESKKKEEEKLKHAMSEVEKRAVHHAIERAERRIAVSKLK